MGADRVLGRVEPGLVGSPALDRGDGAEQVIEQIELVGAQVEEEPAPGDLGQHPPGKSFHPLLSGRLEQGDGDQAHLADRPFGEQFLDLEEGRQAAAVVGHEQGHAGRFARLDHVLALGVAAGHGLFHVHRFAGPRRFDRVLGVGVGRSGHVYRVHLRVGDQRVGVGVPAGHAVAPGVIFGEVGVAPHDRYQLRVFDFLKGGTALDFGDVAAADDAPAHAFHMLATPFVCRTSVLRCWSSPARGEATKADITCGSTR